MPEDDADLDAIRRTMHAMYVRQFWTVVALVVIAALIALALTGVVPLQVEFAED